MATAAQVEEFRLANQALVDLARRDLRDFWGSVDAFGDPTVVRDSLLEFFPEIVTAYGDTAAVLGADWYDLLRDVPASMASFESVMASPAPVVQAQATARWGLGPLFQSDPDPASALSHLEGALQRLVLQPGRDSVFQSARRDPVRTGVARVPSGASTCAFCMLLASRGAVYADRQTAGGDGNRFHSDCDCVPIVVRSDADLPEGYDLAAYERAYQESIVMTGRAGSVDLEATLARMREQSDLN